MNVEKISAVTLRSGADRCFSRPAPRTVKNPILNLEQGSPVAHWGRMIFYVADVDAFWAQVHELIEVGAHTKV